MNRKERNSLGLFDTARRSPEKEHVSLTQEDIERQLDAGAFLWLKRPFAPPPERNTAERTWCV